MTEDSFFVIIQNQISDLNSMQKVRKSHLDYLTELYNDGCVIAGGKFLDNTGAVIIIKADSIDHAKKIAEKDPYIINNIREYEIKHWNRTFWR